MLQTIVVHNHQKRSGFPQELDVDAECVGGLEGVYAVFQHPTNPRWVCTAQGDDGYWTLSNIFDKHWLQGHVDALSKFLPGV
jgi:hypothetical protein